MLLKAIFIVLITLQIYTVSAFASAFDDAIGRINQIKDEGKKVTDKELIDILMPIAKSEEAPEEAKREELNSILNTSYVLFRRDFSKERIQVSDLLKEARHQRRIDYIKAHPDLGPKTKEAIQRGKVLIGMTAEQAKASWGVPDRKHTIIDATRNKERWSYFGRVFLSLEGGRVVRMESLE
jgi:hypothetical protein